jgi:hypothetical protein
LIMHINEGIVRQYTWKDLDESYSQLLFNILSYDETFKSMKVIEVIICLVIGVIMI